MKDTHSKGKGMKNAIGDLGIKVGDVLRLDYLQPVHGGNRRVGRVLSIRDTQRNPVASATRRYREHDSSFCRTRNLIVVKDTRGHIRQFYVERTSRISKPVLGRLRFAVASWFNRRFPASKLIPSGHE